MKASSHADNRHMRMFFVFLCHILLVALTISYVNCDSEKQKLLERRQELDRTIKELARRMVAASVNPEVRVSADSMREYVEQAYTTLRRIDEGYDETLKPV